jgi:hypothetical protein
LIEPRQFVGDPFLDPAFRHVDGVNAHTQTLGYLSARKAF